MACIANYFNALLFLLLLIFNTQLGASEAKRGSKRNRVGLQSAATSADRKVLSKHPALSEVPGAFNEAELTRDFWYKSAQSYIKKKLQAFDVTSDVDSHKRAKNIILLMGDGMSIPTVTATRQFIKDAAHRLSFEDFPVFGLTKTYCVNSQVTDSAASATAYLSGVKTNYGTIGVNAQVPRNDCELGQRVEQQTESIAKWAQEAGKWTGLVTTARVTHASPAALYAHVANRRWECDAHIKRSNCSSFDIIDIARQLVEWPVGRNLRVILGGGRTVFLDKYMKDADGERGKRTDGRNLIQTWIDDKARLNVSAEYVWHKADLLSTDLKKVDYLLGLFGSSHLPYQSELRYDELANKIPTLSEMTKSAIEVLSRGEQGYFLFVEGAKIDMAHHDTRARRSLEETAEFANAVDVALNMTSKLDTLIVVIADHAHTMTIGGYPQRNADILGLNKDKALDDLPYTILSYANGPGYMHTYSRKGRKDLSRKDFKDPKRKYMATVPLEYETHGGDDTGVFASGPHAELFSGNYEQSFLPLLMAKAAEIGFFRK